MERKKERAGGLRRVETLRLLDNLFFVVVLSSCFVLRLKFFIRMRCTWIIREQGYSSFFLSFFSFFFFFLSRRACLVQLGAVWFLVSVFSVRVGWGGGGGGN